MQFTLETEENSRLPFLEIMLIRNGNTIEFDWYRKPYSSNRSLNFFSNHPMQMKMNNALSLMNKVLTLSDRKFHKKNILKVKKILEENNFPQNQIEKITRKAIKKSIYNLSKGNQHTTKENKPTIRLEDTLPVYKTIPYIHPVSQQIKRIIHKHNHTSRLCFKPINKLKEMYTKTKDKVEIRERSNVVYKVTCNECSKVYIGQTSKKLDTRLKQHNVYIEKLTPKSALASHALDKKHTFNFDDPKIIATENTKNKRETLEACHIYINRDETINIRKDTEKIEKNYKYVLDLLKEKRENQPKRRRRKKDNLVHTINMSISRAI